MIRTMIRTMISTITIAWRAARLLTLAGIYTASLLAASAALSAPVPKAKEVDQLAASGHGAFTFAIEPPPKWAVPVTPGGEAPMEHAPVHYRLINEQVMLDGSGESHYNHIIRMVDESSGLSRAASIELQFDPNYQTLTIHHIDVIRQGKRIAKLDRSKVKLLQRETQLERQMYDGTVTASVVVDDVRVGDQIDYDFTVHGSNPVFDGKLVGNVYMLTTNGPVAVSELRITYPATRSVHVKNWRSDLSTSESTIGNQKVLIVKGSNLPQLLLETNMTVASLFEQNVWYTEYPSWNAVATWGSALFTEPSGESPTVDAEARTIMEANATPAARLLAALAFVQSEIRYFGSEFGESSHRPAAPETVINQRFGDCKDKVMLLIALLHRMKIEAQPVLVSTTMHGHIEDLEPTPLAFNHVIARVDLDGTVYFLDGTRDRQTGSLAERQSRGLVKGLLLAKATTTPTSLPSNADFTQMSVHDTFNITDLTKDITLESKVSYFGDFAEGMRNTIAARQPAELEAMMTSWYSRIYGKIQSTAPLEIEDSKDSDKVTISQHFVLFDGAKLDEKKLLLHVPEASWSLFDVLRVPNQQNRVTALQTQAGRAVHEIEVKFGEDVFKTTEPYAYEDSDRVASFHRHMTSTPRSLLMRDEVQFTSDEVPPSEWAAHSEFVKKTTAMLQVMSNVPTLSNERAAALQADATRISADLKSGKLKIPAGRQATATFDQMLRTAQLDSNRLPAGPRSVILAQRGDDEDILGDPVAGAADYKAALALRPDESSVLRGAAVNANLTGDYARTVELTTHALSTRPDDTAALEAQARAYYMQKNYAGAIADWQAVLKDSAAVQRGYPLLWLGLAVQRSGGNVKATLQPYTDAGLSDAWPRPLIDMELGKTTPEAAIAAAKVADAAKTRDQTTEAYFYTAEESLIDGDRSTASINYRLASTVGDASLLESSAAKQRLAELKQ
jgi:lipoprotein NlpI/transglutaminase-like putative cysteine protease